MIYMQIIINSVVCACALAGLIFGLMSFFRKRQPLYSQLVTLAIGCAFLGRLYNVVVIIATTRYRALSTRACSQR